MAKRGRKPKHQGFFESLDPKTIKEVSALIVLALGILLLLAEFNAAGSFGLSIFKSVLYILGYVGYIFTFWVLFAAFYIFKDDQESKLKKLFWGSLVFIILLGTLLAGAGNVGGVFGNSLFAALKGACGDIFSIILLVFAMVITAIISFNFSVADFLQRIADNINIKSPMANGGKTGRVSVFKTVKRSIGMGGKDAGPATAPVITTADGMWVFPDAELLEKSTGTADAGDVNKNITILKKTLSDFGVEVSGGSVNVGPTVTQYELKPSEGVKLNNIKARADDLALALAMHPVRVEAPIPNKSAVGIEVPNKTPARVTLRDVIDSTAFAKRTSSLTLGMGIDVAGNVILADLRKMPHILVAGSTGSGKSVGLNAFLLGLLFQNSPKDLRILLVDPKRVEFTLYNGIPHLLTPVVVDVDKTVNLLKWAITEMERRFKAFELVGSRDIESFNEKAKKGETNSEGQKIEKLPYIVIVIDELADLMMQAANEVESAIVRLAQLARATGIHLVVATQRPSVDVITGLIKANITSRVAFAVASQIDSRTIIDQSGAEKLLGNGDMLFLGGEFNKPKRIQGAFVSEKDVKTVTEFLKKNGSAIYDNSITEHHDVAGIKSKRGGGSMGGLDSSDDLLLEAKKLVVESGTASASFLQRRLSVGYARAARLLDLMEEEGIVGPSRGAKPRDILVDSIDDESYSDSTQDESPPTY